MKKALFAIAAVVLAGSASAQILRADIDKPRAAAIDHPRAVADIDKPHAATIDHPRVAADIDKPRAATIDHPRVADIDKPVFRKGA